MRHEQQDPSEQHEPRGQIERMVRQAHKAYKVSSEYSERQVLLVQHERHERKVIQVLSEEL